jgi:hypothetical protein
MTSEQFIKDLEECSEKYYGLCPPPLQAQKGLSILINHLLGEDWYVDISMGQEQVNTMAVYHILEKYSKRRRLNLLNWLGGKKWKK